MATFDWSVSVKLLFNPYTRPLGMRVVSRAASRIGSDYNRPSIQIFHDCVPPCFLGLENRIRGVFHCRRNFVANRCRPRVGIHGSRVGGRNFVIPPDEIRFRRMAGRQLIQTATVPGKGNKWRGLRHLVGCSSTAQTHRRLARGFATRTAVTSSLENL